jgi:protein-S-isoprenylcysteine O-methyltransferase Ste14
MLPKKIIEWLIKIPPPLALVLAALMMWFCSYSPIGQFSFFLQFDVAIGIFITGFMLFVSAIASFVSEKTTVNPLEPERASHLVTTGVFAFSRNPIYLADAILLIAWFFWLGNSINVIIIVAFIAYITRFQIVREELALVKVFGAEYVDYCAKVRRWI